MAAAIPTAIALLSVAPFVQHVVVPGANDDGLTGVAWRREWWVS